LVFYGLLDGLVNLSVDLGSGKGSQISHGGLTSEGLLEERRNFLNMSLSIDLCTLNTGLLLDSEHQANWN